MILLFVGGGAAAAVIADTMYHIAQDDFCSLCNKGALYSSLLYQVLALQVCDTSPGLYYAED